MPVNRKPRDARNPYFGALAATFTIGAEVSNVKNVAIQITSRGADAAERVPCLVWLSSDANGDVVHATAPDGGVAIGTDGTILVAHTASKVFSVLSEADGDVDINITHAAGAYTCYVNVALGSRKFTSTAVTFA